VKEEEGSEKHKARNQHKNQTAAIRTFPRAYTCTDRRGGVRITGEGEGKRLTSIECHSRFEPSSKLCEERLAACAEEALALGSAQLAHDFLVSAHTGKENNSIETSEQHICAQ
jgi:hypothetical protein